MKIPPPDMKPAAPPCTWPFPPVGADSTTLAAIPLRAGGIAEYSMPYAAAAKAIFVKANGLPAYYRATGLLRYAK
jgi:hypothetical protein